jgi:hypothetical protein
MNSVIFDKAILSSKITPRIFFPIFENCETYGFKEQYLLMNNIHLPSLKGSYIRINKSLKEIKSIYVNNLFGNIEKNKFSCVHFCDNSAIFSNDTKTYYSENVTDENIKIAKIFYSVNLYNNYLMNKMFTFDKCHQFELSDVSIIENLEVSNDALCDHERTVYKMFSDFIEITTDVLKYSSEKQDFYNYNCNIIHSIFEPTSAVLTMIKEYEDKTKRTNFSKYSGSSNYSGNNNYNSVKAHEGAIENDKQNYLNWCKDNPWSDHYTAPNRTGSTNPYYIRDRNTSESY